MQFEIEGTLVKIKDPQSFPSGFVKREFVVRTDEMYPQEVMFELFKDKISLIESYQVNEQIKVSFNIRGREWEGKHFTNLQVSSALSPCRLPVFRFSSSAPCSSSPLPVPRPPLLSVFTRQGMCRDKGARWS